jgi:hypothetical protein
MLYSLSVMTTFGHANLFLKAHWQLMGALEHTNSLKRGLSVIKIPSEPEFERLLELLSN